MRLDWLVEATDAPITSRTTRCLPLFRFVAFLRASVAQSRKEKRKEENASRKETRSEERLGEEKKIAEREEGALRSLPSRGQLPVACVHLPLRI